MKGLVFKLLVEVGTYGLGVKACMLFRCVNRWARDQIILKQEKFTSFTSITWMSISLKESLEESRKSVNRRRHQN